MSLAAHRSVEFAVGVAVALSPILIGLTRSFDVGAVGLIVTVLLGIAIVTAAIAGRREGAEPDPRSHRAFDGAIIAALLVTGVILFALDEQALAVVNLIGAAVEALLLLTTSYVVPGADSDASEGTTTVTG